MPTPRHLRHPAPHPPHRHTTRVPTPTPQHTPPDRHAPPARHTRPLHTHLTTPYHLPFILYLYIRTSPRPTTSPPHSTSIYVPRTHLLSHIVIPSSVALSTLPYSSPPLFRTHSPYPQHLTAIFRYSFPPLVRTHSPRPQHLAAIFLYSFPPLFRAPSAPPSAEKFVLPRLKQAVTHLWKSFVPKEEEDLSSTSYPDDIVWITL